MADINGIPEVKFTAGSTLKFMGNNDANITSPYMLYKNDIPNLTKKGNFYLIPLIPYVELTNDATNDIYIDKVNGFVVETIGFIGAEANSATSMIKTSYDYQTNSLMIPIKDVAEIAAKSGSGAVLCICKSSYINPSGETVELKSNFTVVIGLND